MEEVQALRSKGYKIASSSYKGYCMVKDQDILDREHILDGLETKFVGKDLRYYREVESTNEKAMEIMVTAGNGTVILAEVQTKGKGRLSRSWLSPPGGVCMSLILKPEIPLAKTYLINMMISVAIARTLIQLYGIRSSIKWPNDVLVNEKKICGILIEISAEIDRLEYAIVGIGLNANVNVNDFPPDWNATSLSQEAGSPISRIKLVQALLKEIENAYTQLESPEIYSEWKKLSSTLGRNVRIISIAGEIEGYAVSLTEDGALEIELAREPGKLKRIVAGDCVHLKTIAEPH